MRESAREWTLFCSHLVSVFQWRRSCRRREIAACVFLFTLPFSTSTTKTHPPPLPRHKTQNLFRQALFLNKTRTLANGLQGIPDSFLSYGGPLRADLRADAAFTAAQLVGAPAFDPVTADWSKIYTGFPQPQTPTIGIDNIAGVGDVKVCFFVFFFFLVVSLLSLSIV